MKQTQALAFLMSLALFDATLAQSDDKTDCAKMDFTSLPKDCCAKPFGEVFQTSQMTGNIKDCSKMPNKPMEWANSYKINTLQQKDIKNAINITGKNTIKELCTNGAFMECVFQKNNWLNSSGSINIKALTEYITGAAPETVWRDISQKMLNPMNPSFPNAYDFVNIVEDEFEKISCSGKTVNLLPLIMTQMIQSEFIWMCPKQNMPTSKNKCEETMRNYQYCDGKIYSSQAKGVFYFTSV